MITHLLTRIDLMMNSLSKGQKRIALFIEEHYDKAAFMTASKLGETVGVSESTVVRFATELGYDGYPKLQKAMQEMIRNKLTSVSESKLPQTVSAMTMCLTVFLIRISTKSAEPLKKLPMKILPVQLTKSARQSVFTYSVCVQQPQSQISLHIILK